MRAHLRGCRTAAARRLSDPLPRCPEFARVVIDRLPPQSIEAEQSVLGSLLIDRDAVIEVADFLKPEDFYRQAHGRIYAAIIELSERREPVDVVTVAEALERTGDLEAIGGRAYLATLIEPDAHGGQCRALRAHRGAQGDPAEPDLRRRQDRRDRLRGPRGGRRRPSTAPSRSCSPSASGASPPASRPSRASSTTPTTGWTTSTSTRGRSAASAPASRTSTR